MLFALSIMTFGTPAWADAAAEIRALEDRFVAAFKAKDVDAIMKVYAPDQTLVVFDVVPPRQYIGAAAYRKNWQGLLDGFDGPIAVERNSTHDGLPGGRPQQTGQHPHRGGLPRPVRAEEPEDLTGPDVEVEPLHRRARTERLGEGADLDAAQSMVTRTNFALRSRSTCSIR